MKEIPKHLIGSLMIAYRFYEKENDNTFLSVVMGFAESISISAFGDAGNSVAIANYISSMISKRFGLVPDADEYMVSRALEALGFTITAENEADPND
jgi:hypothetical protein